MFSFNPVTIVLALGMVGLWIALVPGAARAGSPLAVSPLFSDGMVLQRDKPTAIWGQAPEGALVHVALAGASSQAVAKDGHWRVTLDPLPAGGPFDLTIEASGQTLVVRDVYLGEVWLCAGQSNMGWSLRQATGGAQAIAESHDPLLRVFAVPFCAADEPQPLIDGRWTPASPENAGSFSAVAYFFARELREKLDVPVGIIVAQLGGTQIAAWTSPRMLHERFPWTIKSWESTKQSLARHYPNLPTPPDVQRHARSFYELNDLELRYFKGPARLFNGMIAPIAGYSVRGVVWYQGESDQGQAHQYRGRLPAFIEDWRNHWNSPDLPFLIVMLPGFGRDDQGYTFELRDAQFHAHRTVPHTMLVNGVDLGDERDVHPPNKRPLGQRIAVAARGFIYGEPIAPTGPLFRSASFEQGSAIVSFDHLGGGLVVRGDALLEFTLAGEDRVFHPASARIEGDRVIVSSEQVPAPVAVRYAWRNTPRFTLFSAQGLPAAPFRSDDFALITQWDARR